MKRRDFIVNTTTALVSIVGTRARAASPCPPPALSVDSQQPVDTACKDQSADWISRSTAPGVFYANNFTYKNAAGDPITSTADLIAGCSETNHNTALIEWNQNTQLSGSGCLRLNLPASRPGDYSSCNYDFAGIGSTSKSVSKHQFYFQWATYADSVWRNFYYGPESTYGGKIIIVECYNSSFDPGEVVIRRWAVPGGFVEGYRYTAGSYRLGSGANGFGLHWPAYSDYTWDNFLDAGAPTVKDVNTLQQRYGIDYSSQNSQTGTDPDYQWVPRLVENGWTVHELYIDQINDIVKHWMAPYGAKPVLLQGAMTAGLPPVGTSDGANLNPQPIYTGFQLLTYPNSASHWPSADTFVQYDECIGSDNPIDFPGGHQLPFPGTETPAGYPPSGATEI